MYCIMQNCRNEFENLDQYRKQIRKTLSQLSSEIGPENVPLNQQRELDWTIDESIVNHRNINIL